MQRGKNLWLDLKGHFAAGKRGEMGRKGGKIKGKKGAEGIGENTPK